MVAEQGVEEYRTLVIIMEPEHADPLRRLTMQAASLQRSRNKIECIFADRVWRS